MNDNFTHTLSAYEIEFHRRRGNKTANLDELGIRKIADLLISSFDNNEICKNTGYIIKLSKIESDKFLKNGVERIFLRPDSGRRDRPTTLYPTANQNKHPYTFGSDWATTNPYNVLLYQFPGNCENNPQKMYCVFHRVGKSGCKTIFKAQCNELLRQQGIYMEMAWIPPRSSKQTKESTMNLKGVNLILREKSSDITDQLGKSKRRGKVIRALKVNFNSETNNPIKEICEVIKDKLFTRKEILEKVNPCVSGNYNDLDVQISFAGTTRNVHFDDIENLFDGFDITAKVKNTGDQFKDKLTECADQYIFDLYEESLR